VEVGTVTAKPQLGNQKPRLFRLLRDEALINRMGFNNEGAEAMAARLQAKTAPIPLGGNIGKSKVTPISMAVTDYLHSFRLLKSHVNYFVVNVSSPNTPNLRRLQEKEPLKELLGRLMDLNKDPALPLLLKIAPDLEEGQLEDIIDVVRETGVNGVIATNTTIGREGLRTPYDRVRKIGAGGLSGRPLTARATEIIRFLRKHLPENIDIVGVGGIHTGDDAYDKLKAGAKALQIYTSLVYRGPHTVVKILAELKKRMADEGVASIKELTSRG
jgi:dihydroorotate dehydrogenase